MPFEAYKIEARPDGFEITFTIPVNKTVAADPASYKVNSFTYKYHHIYGSPIINQISHAIRSVIVSPDGRRAQLIVDSLRQGYIHEIKMAGVRSESGAPLLHDFAYYTMNQIPGGARLASAPTTSAAPAIASAPRATATANSVVQPQHQTTIPAEWNGKVDQTVSVQGVEGLAFSLPQFDVKAGAHVRLDFANVSDMLHNLVIVRPGTAERVADAALKLGLDGTRLHFVPSTDDVLHHTALIEPQKSETIYFEAPQVPGDYAYICSFPGHAFLMKGTMRVRP
jgi:azurin